MQTFNLDWSEILTWVLVVVGAMVTIWAKRKEWFPRSYKAKSQDKKAKANPATVQTQTGNQSQTPRPEPNWWERNGNKLWIPGGIVFLYFLGFWTFPTWWRDNMVTIWFFVVLSGFVLFGLMLESKKPFKPILGMVGIAVMIFLVAWHFYGESLWKIAEANTKAQAEATKRNAGKTNTSLQPVNNEKEIREWFMSHTDPSSAWDLIRVAQRESQFQQWKADGTVFRGVNPEDTCAMQINIPVWTEDLKKTGYQLDTLDGCLSMALYIYKKDGLAPWNASKNNEAAKSRKEFYIAPVGESSEIVDSSNGVTIDSEGPIWVYDEHGHKHPSDKGAEGNLDQSRWLKFESRTTAPVQVSVYR